MLSQLKFLPSKYYFLFEKRGEFLFNRKGKFTFQQK